ncbi:hypothetical protein G7Z17_g11507 [Cylindrodendrum hubeiense]|uniref:BTB domain-containing protein n=1 Tax=Cylindrodendrum hubeiense TaxID=595255 RepID=A0A9P5H0M1_9HYPO|nr:hypothetical protein G7Z17_g11507 [Cylindrodendrum hubeiense]
MTFRVHRNIVEPESGWFRENLPPPNSDGSPVKVHLDCATEAAAYCLRFIYTGMFLRVSRMAAHLLRIVERTSAELGTLVTTHYLHQTLDDSEWAEFFWHYQNALGILHHEGPHALMMPMRLAMAGVLDATLFWLVRQPAFINLLQTTRQLFPHTLLLDQAEYRRLLKEHNSTTNSPVPTEAGLKKLFEKAAIGDTIDDAATLEKAAPLMCALQREKRSSCNLADHIARTLETTQDAAHMRPSIAMRIRPPTDDYWEETSHHTRSRPYYGDDDYDPDRYRYGGRMKSRSRSPVDSRFEDPAAERYTSGRHRYPSYATDHYGAQRPYRQLSTSSDDWDPYDKFSLDLMSQSFTESSKDGDSDTESPDPDERALAKDEKGKPRTAQATAVKASLYTGNAELGGSHTATLTAIHGPNDRKQSLFRWLRHVRQEVMNFEDLWMEISCVSGLSDLEKRAVTRLRGDVKSSSDLQGDALTVNAEPSRDLTMGNQGKILVSYGESVAWSLAADECQTWFAFISKFQAFWPKNLEFWHQGHVITAAKWPRILRLVSHVRSSVKITMKIGCLPDAPPRAVLKPEVQSGTSTGDGQRETDNDDFVHVMMLPKPNRKRASAFAQNTAVKAQLDSAHMFLMQDTSYSNRSAYKSCQTATRKECYEYLNWLASKVEDNGTEEVRRAYEEKIDIFNTTETLYRFFIPRDFEDPTSRKFWGAVRSMLELRQLEPNYTHANIDNTVLEIRKFLRNLTPSLIAFQNIMSHATEEERVGVEAPQEFVTAWLYVVMGMVYGSQDHRRWSSRTARMRELLEQGMKKLMHWLPDKSLLERTSMLPLEVLSLMTFGLLQDQVGKSDDICETYSQYLNSLSDRSYQHRIDLVQQEISAVKRTLKRQRNIISSIRTSLTALDTHKIVVQNREESTIRREREKDRYTDMAPPPPPPPLRPQYPLKAGFEETATIRPANDYMGLDDEFIQEISLASKLSSTDAGGLRGLFFMECSRLIEQREFEFLRYADYANDLERAINFKMNFTKDRQENAIFAFTLVTIVFLPISTVSSIFGMNTTDVRDMESSQWLYWAVALPVTLVVIVAGLWWMGELGNIARWFMRKPRQSSRGVYGGPVMMPQQVDQPYFSSAPLPGPMAMNYGPTQYVPGMHRVGTQGHYAPTSVWQGRARSEGY